MRILVSLFCGTLFGAGLLISGMTDPQKVLGFLDVAAIPDGNWDPSLALVMAGGLLIAFPIFRFAKSRNTAVCGGTMELPTRRDIDRNLVIGGLMFGIGWGMVGYCPGPAISALAFGHPETIAFIIAMIAGMFFHKLAAHASDKIAS